MTGIKGLWAGSHPLPPLSSVPFIVSPWRAFVFLAAASMISVATALAEPPPAPMAPVPAATAPGQETSPIEAPRVYANRLVRIENPRPLLADYPEFFEPIEEETHFEAPAIIDDPAGDLAVRAWRFSYNARCSRAMPPTCAIVAQQPATKTFPRTSTYSW